MSRVIALFILTFSSIFAQDVEDFPFIGVTISFDSTDILTTDNDVDASTSANIGVRYGQQTVDWRSMISYSRSSEQKMLAIEIDKILLDELFGTSIFRPYIGFSAGLLKIDEPDLIDDSSYFYGFNAGLIIYATDTLDADLGYHYYETFDDNEVANMQGAALSLHYFY